MIERKFSATGLLLAAIVAPASSTWIWLIIMALVGRSTGDVGTTIVALLFFSLLMTLWGALPAGAFGAAVLLPFERLWKGRNPPVWAFALAGLIASSLYVAFGMAAATWSQPLGLLTAPWAIAILETGRGEGDMAANIPSVLASVLGSGPIAGLVYERCSRVVQHPAARLAGDG